MAGLELHEEDDPAARVARLRALVERTRPVSTADQRTLPVLPVLEALLPDGGLRRGSVVQVDGQVGATSLALAITAGPTRAGSWVACVDVAQMGWAAAAEAGVDLDRLAVVRSPGRSWATVMAALVDAFDVVLCELDSAPSATEVRRLHARARERGAVLVVLGGRRGEVGPARRAWPDAADVGFTVLDARWSGLGQGWGNLRSRRVTVEVAGRRGLARPRRLDVLLPGPDGAPASAGAADPTHAADPTRATTLRPGSGTARDGGAGSGTDVVPLRQVG